MPQARTSILHLFGIGEVRIEFVDRLPAVRPDAPLDLGTAIDPADAPFPLLRPAAARRARRHLSRGRRRDAAVRHPGAGAALVTEIADSGFTPAVGKKLAAAGTRVEFVPIHGVGGAGALDHRRAHVVHLPGGPARLAANTLIWTRGRLTIRLEGAATLQQARAIAESLG